MRAALVIGTRPQIIKSAPIILASRRFPQLDLVVIHTGQHYDYSMSRVFFKELSLPDPAFNLGVGSGPHGWQTGQMLIELEKVYEKNRPDVVLVPGDTNSTLAGGLAAVKMHIPVAHVESGARSGDFSMPEEVNRILVDHLSDTLFTVTRRCSENLEREGISPEKVNIVGDTMYESVCQHMGDLAFIGESASLGLDNGYGVVTLHRAENTDDEARLTEIFHAFNDMDIDLVFPCHPRTKAKLVSLGLLAKARRRFRIIDPLPYFELLSLIMSSSVVFTDSGGVQKEAFWLRIPCITLRDTTEWVETVEAKANILVGSKVERILEASRSLVAPEKWVIGGDAGGLLIENASMSILQTLVEKYG
jgi:UDP-GlcNAc3NAcA epimerase